MAGFFWTKVAPQESPPVTSEGGNNDPDHRSVHSKNAFPGRAMHNVTSLTEAAVVKPQRPSITESIMDENFMHLRESKYNSQTDQRNAENQGPNRDASGTFMGHLYFNDDRPKWEGRFDYLMTMLGFSLDLSAVWRLPFLCYKHKGICFILPYFIMVIICGLPLLYLEFILGQFLQESPVGMWKVCPLFKGCGYAMMFVTYLISYTYNVYVTWMVLYFVGSLNPPPDWVNCTHEWNTHDCIALSPYMVPNKRNGNLAGKEYFENYILKKMDPKSGKPYDIMNLAAPDPLHVVYFSMIYLLFIVFMVRGMQNSVKVMTLSTGFPAIILAMLLFRGSTLRGSKLGINFLFQSKCFESYLSFQTWLDAASQTIYSISLGFGVHVSIASLIPSRTKAFRNAIIVVTTILVTSLIAIFVVFTLMGAVAFILKEDVDKQEFNEQNVLFDVISCAIGLIPSSNFFALMFYFMLFCLTFSCQVAGMHSVVLNLRDAFGAYGHPRRFRSCTILTFTLVSFYAVGVLSLAKGGHDVVYAVEDFISSSALLICVAVQAIGICWFYGVDNVCRAEFAMNGVVPPLFIRICWKFVAPSVLCVLVLGELIKNAPTTQFKSVEQIRELVGYILGWFPLLIIVLVAFVQLLRVRGPKRLLCLISPEIEHQRIRETGMGARACRRHWSFVGTRKQMEVIFPHLQKENKDQKPGKGDGRSVISKAKDSIVSSRLFTGIKGLKQIKSNNAMTSPTDVPAGAGLKTE